MKEIIVTPIGTVHSPFTGPKGTPIQPAAARGVEGSIEIFDEYVDGLKDLEGFSHITLLFHFHLAAQTRLQVKPYMDNTVRGVFATRAPSRPNHIGISTVKLLSIDGLVLRIQDVDIIDGTPLLDIKPYVPRFDLREADIRTGWLEKRVDGIEGTCDDGRFVP